MQLKKLCALMIMHDQRFRATIHAQVNPKGKALANFESHPGKLCGFTPQTINWWKLPLRHDE